jgi:membrane protease YdiL (CAAX protease family)
MGAIPHGADACPLRRRTGDLVAPLALHAVTNVGIFTLVSLASPSPA